MPSVVVASRDGFDGSGVVVDRERKRIDAVAAV